MPNPDLRQRVLDAALSLFSEVGYEHCTIAGICARAGVSNGAIFHHFPSKEAIAEALYVAGIASFQEGLAHILEARPSSVREAIRAAVFHHLNWNESHRDLAAFMYNRGRPEWTPGRGEAVDRLNRDIGVRIRTWLAPFIASGEIREVSLSVLAACVVGPAHFIAHRWLSGIIKDPPTAFAEELAEMACAALVPTPAETKPIRRGDARTPASGILNVRALRTTGDPDVEKIPPLLAGLGARVRTVSPYELHVALPMGGLHADGDGSIARQVAAASLAACIERALLSSLPAGRAPSAYQTSISFSGTNSGFRSSLLRIEAKIAHEDVCGIGIDATLKDEFGTLARASANYVTVGRDADESNRDVMDARRRRAETAAPMRTKTGRGAS